MGQGGGCAVTSERKRAANRRNARASTGPKTAAGKAQVARNASRHGLTLAVADDPALARDVEELAQAICRNFSGGCGDEKPAAAAARRLGLARRVAEAQIDVVRVRRARHGLIAQALADPRYLSPRGLRSRIALLGRAGDLLRRGVPVPPEMQDAILKRPQGPQKFALVLADCTRQLAAMDRYERRALSRRKTAIRAFDAAWAASRTARGKRAVRSLRVPAPASEHVPVREADRPAASCQNKATAAPRQGTLALASDKTKPTPSGSPGPKARPRCRDRPAGRLHHRGHARFAPVRYVILPGSVRRYGAELPSSAPRMASASRCLR